MPSNSLIKRRVQWCIFFLIALASIVFIYRSLGIAAHFLLFAFAGAYLFHPVEVWLERKKIRRSVAVPLTILISLSVLALLGYTFVPLIYSELRDLFLSLPEIL